MRSLYHLSSLGHWKLSTKMARTSNTITKLDKWFDLRIDLRHLDCLNCWSQPPQILYESSVLTHGRPTTLQDGIHLGAFCHYKPTVLSLLLCFTGCGFMHWLYGLGHVQGKQRKQWESAVRAADGKHARFQISFRVLS